MIENSLNIQNRIDTNPLAIDEYTKESEIIKNGTEVLIVTYFALTKTNRDAPSNNTKQFTDLSIINDLRRIEQYHEEKPDECIKFIKNKYKMNLMSRTVFIECLKLIIDENSVFMFMLKQKGMLETLDIKVQQEFALKINDARNQLKILKFSQPKQKFVEHTENKEEKPKLLSEENIVQQIEHKTSQEDNSQNPETTTVQQNIVYNNYGRSNNVLLGNNHLKKRGITEEKSNRKGEFWTIVGVIATIVGVIATVIGVIVSIIVGREQILQFIRDIFDK